MGLGAARTVPFGAAVFLSLFLTGGSSRGSLAALLTLLRRLSKVPGRRVAWSPLVVTTMASSFASPSILLRDESSELEVVTLEVSRLCRFLEIREGGASPLSERGMVGCGRGS
jgi:hypothetical protein